MPLNYDPQDAVRVIPEGEYQATLIKVEDGVTGENSQNPGQPKQVWTWRVYAGDQQIQLQEHVTIPAGTWKIGALAYVLGRKDDFEQGTFQADNHINSTIMLQVKVQKGDAKFPKDQNRVGKYLPRPRAAQRPAPTGPAAPQGRRPTPPQGQPVAPYGDEQQFAEDDIPF